MSAVIIYYYNSYSTGGTKPDNETYYLSYEQYAFTSLKMTDMIRSERGNYGIYTTYIFNGWEDYHGGHINVSPYSPITFTDRKVYFPIWFQGNNLTAIWYSMNISDNQQSYNLGNPPRDALSPYQNNSRVTVMGIEQTRSGYTFVGWTENGTTYLPGSTLTTSVSIVTGVQRSLFALWTSGNKYTIFYHNNGSTGGSVPIDASSPYNLNTSGVVILGNSGTLVKTGCTFQGWTTAADGGNYYAGGATITVSANTILYAKWSGVLTYDGNGNNGGTVPVDPSSPYLSGSTVTVLGNSGSLVKNQFSFNGWNTAANGSGTSYAVNSTFVFNSGTTLYVNWTPTYTVTYLGNGSDGGAVPVDTSSPYVSGLPFTFLGNVGSLIRTGYVFNAWNTAADGLGTTYAAGSTFPAINADTILYAKWSLTYKITYNGNGNNGGNVPSDSTIYLFDNQATVLGNTGTLVKSGGYTFGGWNTAANGSGTTYVVGLIFPVKVNITLYARWTSYTITYIGNGNNSGTVPVDASSPHVSGFLVTVLGNTGSLVKTGSVSSGWGLSGWNTAADGSGTSYAVGSTFPINSNTTLYAVWNTTYNVTYLANIPANQDPDDSSPQRGTVPVDVLSPYFSGSKYKVLHNRDYVNNVSLENNKYTFSGYWKDSNGTIFNPYFTYVITANVTLLAQWHYTQLTNTGTTMVYDGNGNTTGNPPIDTQSPYSVPDGTIVRVTLLGKGTLTKTGYDFAGWRNVLAGLDSPIFQPGYQENRNSSMLLMAIWNQNTTTYTITYDGNEHSNGFVPVDALSPYLSYSSVKVLGNTGNFVKNGGYTFGGWNTLANGLGTTYAANSIFFIEKTSVTLYAKWTIITVTYNGNGSTSGTVPADTSSYVSGEQVTVKANTGILVKTNYIFGGWNTLANGLGTSYTVGGTFNINDNKTLYAIWVLVPTFTVTYVGNNESEGGNAPVDTSSPYVSGSPFTVIGNTGNLVKTGFDFDDWNTAADGLGITYISGEEYEITEDLILYATWTLTTYTVTYDGNEHNDGDAPVDDSSPYVSGSTFIVLENTGGLVKTGFDFDGWNTAPDGSGITYTYGEGYQITENLILYAYWSPVVRYAVTYSGNGHTGGTVPVDFKSPYIPDLTVTVLANTGILVKTGFVFGGWNTLANGSGTTYSVTSPGNTFTISDGDVTLYAKWSYTVTYSGNGNTGGTAPPVDSKSPYTPGSTVTVIAKPANLVKTGFVFGGWNIAPDGSGINYSDTSPGNTFTIRGHVTLYAKWTSVVTYKVTYNGNKNTGGTAPVDSNSYASGSTVTVLPKPAALVRKNYTFSGWNTLANGLGTNRAVSGTFNISGNVTLYAKWTYTVNYNGNGNTGGAVPKDTKSPYVSGSTVTVLAKPAALVKSGFVFNSWNTLANGLGTKYIPGKKYIVNGNLILYAIWTQR